MPFGKIRVILFFLHFLFNSYISENCLIPLSLFSSMQKIPVFLSKVYNSSTETVSGISAPLLLVSGHLPEWECLLLQMEVQLTRDRNINYVGF